MMQILIIIIVVILFLFSLISFLRAQSLREQAIKMKAKAESIKIQKQNLQQQIEDRISNLSNEQARLIEQIQIKKEQYDNLSTKEKNRLNMELQTYRQNIAMSKENLNQDLQCYLTQIKGKEEAAAAHLTEQIQALNQQLNKLKETKAAAIKASLQEQQIKNNKEEYCLIPSSSDLDDIARLERVKKELHKPRILSMLIWQTYWQPLAKKQFPIILKSATPISGIYKITNLATGQCYIGQAVDIYKRWCEHCKCGLGIDTPSGNKLYKAIMDYGLQNFSFEVVEQCSKEQLNEKEKYFIELYQAKQFGYNGTGGNK